MLKLKQVRAVFFDFFGTLVEYKDTYAVSLKTTVSLLKKNNISIEEKFLEKVLNSVFNDFEKKAQKLLNEYSMSHVMMATFQRLHIDINPKLLEKCIILYLKEWSRSVYYDNFVPKLLEDLSRDYPIAIITNTHYPPLIKYHLRAMNIKSLSFPVVTSVEFGRRKPCSTIFHHATNLIGVLPQNGLMVGDSLETDYHGGLNAGMQAVLIDKTKKKTNIHSISSVHDLRKMLL